MQHIYEIITFHVTYLDSLFGLKTLTFNNKECANDFCNELLLEKCEFVHFYENKTCTIFLKDESAFYVP